MSIVVELAVPSRLRSTDRSAVLGLYLLTVNTGRRVECYSHDFDPPFSSDLPPKNTFQQVMGPA